MVASSVAVAAPDIRPRLWEVQTQTEIPGMPSGIGVPAVTLEHCFTTEDIQENTPIQPDHGDCKTTHLQQNGNQITWNMQCSGEQTLIAEGNGTFSGDHYAMQTQITMQQGPVAE